MKSTPVHVPVSGSTRFYKSAVGHFPADSPVGAAGPESAYSLMLFPLAISLRCRAFRCAQSSYRMRWRKKAHRQYGSNGAVTLFFKFWVLRIEKEQMKIFTSSSMGVIGGTKRTNSGLYDLPVAGFSLHSSPFKTCFMISGSQELSNICKMKSNFDNEQVKLYINQFKIVCAVIYDSSKQRIPFIFQEK